MRTGHCQQPDVVLKLDPVCTHVPTDRDPSTAIFRFLDSCCEPVGDMSAKAPDQATQVQDAKKKQCWLWPRTNTITRKRLDRLCLLLRLLLLRLSAWREGNGREGHHKDEIGTHNCGGGRTDRRASGLPASHCQHTHTHTHTITCPLRGNTGGGPYCHLPRVTCDGARALVFIFFDASSAQICPNAIGPCCLGPCASQGV